MKCTHAIFRTSKNLAKLKYFTNPYFPEIKGVSFQKATFWGEKRWAKLIVITAVLHGARPYKWPSSWCFQPISKICSSNWIISPGRGENKNIFETTTQPQINGFHRGLFHPIGTPCHSIHIGSGPL